MREKLDWPGVVGVGVVLVLLVSLAFTAAGIWPALTGSSGATLAAWVQAVGSVVALILTGGLAVWEANRRRVEDRARAADQLFARVAVLEFASSIASDFVDRQASDERTRVPRPVAPFEGVSTAFTIAEQVTVLDMPTKEAVQAYFSFTAGVSAFRLVLARNEGLWMHEVEIERLSSVRDRLERAVKGIEAEARRLAAGDS